MEFEHFAINVKEPAAMAAWYVKHFEMKIVVGMDEPPYMHFLADRTGRIVVETYYNPKGAVPDYASQHHLTLHWAFAVDDPAAVRDRIVADGASVVEEVTLDDGTYLIMTRDPWGLALQLCKRAKPWDV